MEQYLDLSSTVILEGQENKLFGDDPLDVFLTTKIHKGRLLQEKWQGDRIKKIIWPLCLWDHWMLLVADTTPNNRTFVMYCSYGRDKQGTSQCLIA